MKKLITTTAILLGTFSVFAQADEKGKPEYRLKTNPLSPAIAYEPNINFSLERFVPKGKNGSGIQASMGYMYDWNLLEKNIDNPSLNVGGIVLTGEYRMYFSGFFFGPYVQYKNVKGADYKVINNGFTTYHDISKKATSAGFLAGYQFLMGEKIGNEFHFNVGMSNKQLYDNGAPIKEWSAASDNSIVMIDRTGRFPQFIFTYKLFYRF